MTIRNNYNSEIKPSIQGFVNKYKSTGFYANEDHRRRTKQEEFEKKMNKRPEPIRLLYPYFEKPTRPYSKCPICVMHFYNDEMTEHAAICADSVYG